VQDYKTPIDIIMSAIMSANKFVESIVTSIQADPLYAGLATAVALGLGWYDNKIANPAVELN
jgi:uncharacterized membrane protein YbjE (DUF340 family)